MDGEITLLIKAFIGQIGERSILLHLKGVPNFKYTDRCCQTLLSDTPTQTVGELV